MEVVKTIILSLICHQELEHVAGVPQYGLQKLPVEMELSVVYMHMRLTVNSI